MKPNDLIDLLVIKGLKTNVFLFASPDSDAFGLKTLLVHSSCVGIFLQIQYRCGNNIHKVNNLSNRK